MRQLFSVFAVVVLMSGVAAAQAKTSPGAGPSVVVVETEKGTFEFETYPNEAPRTVEHILALVKKNFYNGQRFHRAEPNFVIQVGDPVSRDYSRQSWWGRQSSGTPIGVAEITKKRKLVLGAVAMGYPGTDKAAADSQFFILRRAAPELDGKYTVFGKVLKGMDAVGKIQRGDVLKRAYLKE